MSVVRANAHIAVLYFLLGFFMVLSAAPWVSASANSF